MKRGLIVVAAAVGALAIIFTAYRLLLADEGDEDIRYANGLTELVVSNLSGSGLTLFRAGSRLSDTSRVADVTDESMWLVPGNYFLHSEQAGVATHYPVPLTGYRCGPDENGSYLVTVRPMPQSIPPAATDTSPGYAYIPAGNFLIGDRQNPRERHYVWLTGFFIGRFETTNGEFREFLEAADGYRDDSNWTPDGLRWKAATPSTATALLAPGDDDYPRFGMADQPVTLVPWFEANAYCKWLTRRNAGRKWQFSLPTDAEWEKAARGPDNFDYGLSLLISDAEEGLYNWKKNPDAPVTVIGIDSTRARPLRNRFGLFHMTGNVAEWTQSVERQYNRDHPYADDDRNHDDAPGRRTVRGGSWYSAAISILQIPYRDTFQPEHRTRDVGFRVVARILP
jgi:formylglycine-generating enzyme required for sulfatase activity